MIAVWIIGFIAILFCFVVFFGAPYVPSHRSQVRRAFTSLRPLKKSDTVVDLGSGDGVVLRQAIALGAKKAVGYELNPALVWISRFVSRRYGRAIDISVANMWSTSPPAGTTVVYVFSVGRDLDRLVALLHRWADELDKPIDCVMYGHELPGVAPARQDGAHSLYTFLPLHRRQAQV